MSHFSMCEDNLEREKNNNWRLIFKVLGLRAASVIWLHRVYFA